MDHRCAMNAPATPNLAEGVQGEVLASIRVVRILQDKGARRARASARWQQSPGAGPSERTISSLTKAFTRPRKRSGGAAVARTAMHCARDANAYMLPRPRRGPRRSARSSDDCSHALGRLGTHLLVSGNNGGRVVHKQRRQEHVQRRRREPHERAVHLQQRTH